MSNESTVLPNSAAATPAGAHAMSPYAEFLLRVAERFGVPTVLLLVVAWWVKVDLLHPLLDAHFDVVGKIVQGQEEHSRQLEGIGTKLDTLIRVSQHAPPQNKASE